MLPPVESSILVANPKFEALHRDLCSNKLDERGCSRLDAKAQRERDSLGQELRKARLETARREIVQSRLESLAYRGEELPDEFRELVAIAAATLSGEIGDEDREIVNDELERLQEEVGPIARALSKQFTTDATTLCRLLAHGNPLPIADMPRAVENLKTDIQTSHSRLAQLRLGLAEEVQALHALYRQVLETSIRILEQTIHGSVARGTKAKADYLAIMAEGMSKKLSLQHSQLLQQVYSAEVQDALKTKAAALREESMVLRRKIREAEEKLEEYRRAKGVQGMVREYAEILKETAKVREEVARLEGRAR